MPQARSQAEKNSRAEDPRAPCPSPAGPDYVLFLASGARRGCWRCQIQSIPTPPRPHHASLSGALLLEQDGSGATLVRMMMMIGTGEPDHNVRMMSGRMAARRSGWISKGGKLRTDGQGFRALGSSGGAKV